MKKQSLSIFICSLLSIISYGQIQIHGSIIDNSETPLGGVTILIAGSTTGAITDFDGNFTLEVDALPVEITASYLGFKQEVMTITNAHDQLQIVMSESSNVLDEVIISASRRAEKITEAPTTISVIGAKQLEEVTAPNYLELVGREKGIDFVQKGVNEFDINMRGFSTAFNTSTLFLTDGRLSNVISANLPYQIMNPLIKEDIERMEVILGPSSSLYGANAFSGLINIQTKNPFSKPGTSITQTLGEQNISSTRIATRHKINDNVAFKINAELSSWTDFEFDDPLHIPVPNVGILEVKEIGLVNDHDSNKVNGSVYFKLGSQKQLIFDTGYSKSDYITPTSVGRNYYEDWMVSYQQLRYTSPKLFAQISRIKEDNDDSYTISTATLFNFLPANHPLGVGTGGDKEKAIKNARFVNDNTRITGEIQYNDTLGSKFDYVIGVQGLFDEAFSDQTSLDDFDGAIKQQIISVYAQGDYRFSEKFKTVFSLRLDEHNTIGSSLTPKIALVHKAGDTGTVRLTYSRGFKYPTLQEYNAFILGGLFYGGQNRGFTLSDGTKISPLKAVTVNSYEMGYKAVLGGNFLIDANAYYEINEDFISSSSLQGVTHSGDIPVSQFPGAARSGNFTSYINFGRVDIYGFDLGLKYVLNDNANLKFNYSYVGYEKKLTANELSTFDANQNRKLDESEVPVNTPTNKFGIGFFYSKNKFSGNIFGNFVEEYNFFNSLIIASASQNYSILANTPNITENSVVITNPILGGNYNDGPLGGYFSIDLNLNYKLNSWINIGASANNLFDTEVRNIAGAPVIGRIIRGEIQLNF